MKSLEDNYEFGRHDLSTESDPPAQIGWSTQSYRQIALDVDSNVSSVTLPLPRIALPERSAYEWPGWIAASYNLDPSLWDWINGCSSVPRMNQLVDAPGVALKSGGGRIVPRQGQTVAFIEAEAEDLTAHLHSRDQLVLSFFKACGIEARISGDARHAERIMSMLGGPVYDSVAMQPAARAVIESLLRSPSGKVERQLREIIRRNQGSWTDVSAVKRGDYPTQLLRHLANSGLIHVCLEFECVECGTINLRDIDRLSDMTGCEFCGHMERLARMAFESRRPRLVLVGAHSSPAEKLQEVLPVMAALSVIKSAIIGDGSSVYSVGVDISLREISGEIDFVVLAEVNRPGFDGGSSALIHAAAVASSIAR
jgi:hypothetical protein